jgi:hypothetical protein
MVIAVIGRLLTPTFLGLLVVPAVWRGSVAPRSCEGVLIAVLNAH